MTSGTSKKDGLSSKNSKKKKKTRAKTRNTPFGIGPVDYPVQAGLTKKAQKQLTGQKSQIDAFCSTIMCFPATLQVSRSAPHARIGLWIHFCIRPFITKWLYDRLATTIGLFGTNFKIAEFVPDRPEKLCTYRR